MLRGLGILTLIAAVQAQGPGLTLVLEAEGKQAVTVYHDEPLSFSVSICDRKLNDDLARNLGADAELKILAADFKAGKIREEEYRKETERLTATLRPLKFITVGTEQSPWHARMELRISDAKQPWPATLVSKFPDTPVIVFDEQHNYVMARHATSPEQMLRLEPGAYRILLSLGEAQSNPVDVTVLRKKMPADVAHSEEMRMKLGRYYRQAGDADRALIYAEGVLNQNPANIGALILQGESHLLKKNWKAALAAFEQALARVIEEQRKSPEAEPPEYLEDTIDWLQRQK